VNLGLPIDNIKVHPHIINCCQPSVSPVVLAKRGVQWGCKILGAFVGTDECVIHELGNKMRKINNLTDVLIQHPKHQFRYYLHRFYYDSKVNYWLRTQLPYHGNRLVDGFREQQMRLVASYHGVSEKIEVENNWPVVYEWYERATLPIEKGGMAIRNMGVVALTAFACSLAASLKHMASIFPEWVTLGQGDQMQISHDASPEMSAQVLHCIELYRRRVPQGMFKENDSFPAIIKNIVDIESGDVAASRETQLQGSSQDPCAHCEGPQSSRRRTSQGGFFTEGHPLIKQEAIELV
jgi:hypothetical protein